MVSLIQEGKDLKAIRPVILVLKIVIYYMYFNDRKNKVYKLLLSIFVLTYPEALNEAKLH